MGVYVDTDSLKLFLKKTNATSDENDAIDRLAIAISGAIEEQCDRTFDKASDESERVYTAEGPMIVTIDDHVSISKVEVDLMGSGSFTEWTDYQTAPANAEQKGKPIEWLLPPRTRCWPHHYDAVRVTGIVGWPTVPAQVVEASELLAEQLWKRKAESPFGILGLDQQTAVRVMREDPMICGLLEGLQRTELV